MKRNIRLLYIHNFLTDFRFQAAYLVIFFDQILGSYTAAMAILATENITSAIMDIPTGYISDRIGRKATLTIGSACSAVSVGCYAFANHAVLLFLGAIFGGLSSCLFNGNNNALLFETLKADGIEDQFHHFQGRTSSMFQLALGLSALCSSFMAIDGLRLVFILGIVPQILAAFVSFFFQEPRIHIPSEHKGMAHFKMAFSHVIQNPRLRLLVIGQAISYGAGEALFNFRNAYVAGLWPVWAIGIYRGANNAFGFIGFWFAGRILDRIKPPYMLALAETYWFSSQVIAVALSNVITPIILLTEAVFFGPFMVARDQLLQAEFADEQRATMGSVASFTGSLFYAVMAISIGSISDHFGLIAAVGFGIAVSAFSLPIYVQLFRRHFQRQAHV